MLQYDLQTCHHSGSVVKCIMKIFFYCVLPHGEFRCLVAVGLSVYCIVLLFSPVSPTLLASFASFDDGEDDPRARMKKGILPKQATHVMKTWLFQHLVVSSTPLLCIILPSAQCERQNSRQLQQSMQLETGLKT